MDERRLSISVICLVGEVTEGRSVFRPYFTPGLSEASGFDIYIDGEWHGSRRTLSFCRSYGYQKLRSLGTRDGRD